MFYDIIIYFYLGIIMILVTTMVHKYMLVVLMMFEMLALNIVLLMFMVLSMMDIEIYVIFYLVFVLCDGVLGLMVLVLVVRYFGNEYYNFYDLVKF